MEITSKGLTGRGLLQSTEEWAVRNSALAGSLALLAGKHISWKPSGRGLDVGCQGGFLTDYLNAHTPISWEGIDPILTETKRSPGGALLHKGIAENIPYTDSSFDCLVFANVFEHIAPGRRHASFVEMRRVLRPGAIIVGQLPNPYFPIESHSRLPFMGWLPLEVQKKYWRLSPVPWEHDFFVATPRHIRKEAEAANLEIIHTSNFNYPISAFPQVARPIAHVLKVPMRRFPWAWQFVLRRPT